MYAAYLASENSEPAKCLEHDAGSDHSNLYERNAMAKAKFYVYVHRRADTGEAFYVGKGSGSRATSTQGRPKFWKNVKGAHGLAVEIVAMFWDEQPAFDHERALIAECRAAGERLTNCTDGGEGASGAKRTEETKRLLSEANKGKRLGMKASPETRAKQSAVRKGRKQPPEAVARVAAFHTGRKRSAETLAKMSAALKGKPAGKHLPELLARIQAGRIGTRHSDETRAKMKERAKDRNKGITRSPETRAKMSAAKIKYWAEKKANAAT